MKLKLSMFAVAAALSVPTVASAFQGTAMTDLPLRAGPGPMHPIVGTIDRSSPVEVEGCIENGNWCQVAWSGKRGWAYAANLGAQSQGKTVIISEARSELKVPPVTYQEQVASTTTSTGSTGAAAGGAGGVIAGALIAGPIGAAVGGLAGLAAGAIVDPPDQVRTYVTSHKVDPVYLEGEVVVGSALPTGVKVYEVPEYKQYRYAYVNGQTVLVEPGTSKVVHVYR